MELPSARDWRSSVNKKEYGTPKWIKELSNELGIPLRKPRKNGRKKKRNRSNRSGRREE
jgi:hypothetical protein